MNRKSGITIGILFLIATISYIIGDSIILAHLRIEQVHLPISVGVFLEYINAFSVVGIAVLLYPFLNKKSPYVAIAYLSSRIIESVLLFISTIFPSLSKCVPYEATSNTLFESGYVLSFQIGMLSLSLGSIILCYWLYKHSYIPKWISILGFLGYACLLVSSIIAIVPSSSGFSNYLYVPGAIFELIFPIYMIIKGLDAK